jgi:molybdenum cofactor biosynthesis protein B
MSHQAHQAEAATTPAVPCAILTISDSRTLETDASGPAIEACLRKAGHEAVARDLVADEPALIGERLDAWIADQGIRAILTTGGTGIGRRDSTVEVVRRRLTTEIEGFGELFRMVSFNEIGASAMMSRAIGGLVIADDDKGGDTAIFAMPGSRNAVETAMRTLVAPQLRHIAWLRRT